MGSVHIVLAVLLNLSLARTQDDANNQVFRSDHGYSFVCPRGWTLLTSATSADYAERLARWVPNLEIDGSGVDAYGFEGMEPGAPNACFTVEKGAIPVDEASESELLAAVRSNYEKNGMRLLGEMDLRRTRIGDCDAYVLDYSAEMPAAAATFRQRQLLLSAGSRTIVATFTAAPERFADAEAAFGEITRSLAVEMPEGVAAIWQSLPAIVRAALIGALLGLLAALVKRQLERRKSAAADESGVPDPPSV